MPHAGVHAAERRLVHRLQRSGATSPASAHALDGLPRWERSRLAHLLDEGVVRKAGRDGYYLDRVCWTEHLAVQRRLALLLAGFAAAVLALAAWLAS